jgi:hypothetical protein
MLGLILVVAGRQWRARPHAGEEVATPTWMGGLHNKYRRYSPVTLDRITSRQARSTTIQVAPHQMSFTASTAVASDSYLKSFQLAA